MMLMWNFAFALESHKLRKNIYMLTLHIIHSMAVEYWAESWKLQPSLFFKSSYLTSLNLF